MALEPHVGPCRDPSRARTRAGFAPRSFCLPAGPGLWVRREIGAIPMPLASRLAPIPKPCRCKSLEDRLRRPATHLRATVRPLQRGPVRKRTPPPSPTLASHLAPGGSGHGCEALAFARARPAGLPRPRAAHPRRPWPATTPPTRTLPPLARPRRTPLAASLQPRASARLGAGALARSAGGRLLVPVAIAELEGQAQEVEGGAPLCEGCTGSIRSRCQALEALAIVSSGSRSSLRQEPEKVTRTSACAG